jgi:hypothetical protein
MQQLMNLANAKLQNIREGTSAAATLIEEETALSRKLLSLGSLLMAERRESLYFRADTTILHKIRDSLQRLFQAVLDLNQPSVDCKVLSQGFRTQFEAIEDLFKHSCSSDCRALVGAPSVFVSRLLSSINAHAQLSESVSPHEARQAPAHSIRIPSFFSRRARCSITFLFSNRSATQRKPVWLRRLAGVTSKPGKSS